MSVKSITSNILVSAILLQTNFAFAQNSCRSLILSLQNHSRTETGAKVSTKQRLAEYDSERRSSVRTWNLVENLGARQSSSQYSFMPSNMNYSVYREGVKSHLVLESTVSIDGVIKLKQEHLPIDAILEIPAERIKSESVINAGLDTGRKFLNELFLNREQLQSRAQNASGIYLFVDVNNLGWVNKNFAGQKQTGDLYIKAVTRVLQKYANERGLIFRLGGDEFALMLEPMSAVELQKLMTDISADVKKNVHFIFREESIRRAAAFRIIHEDFKNGRITEQQYNEALAEFKNYTAYSQEGVSLGASYVDGRSPELVQKSAEDMALQMKLAVKMSHQQDVSKYTGQSVAYDGPPRLNFVYEVPIIEFNLQSDRFKGSREVRVPSVPAVQMKRQQVLKHLGPLNIVKYISETGEMYVFAEYFDSAASALNESVKPVRIEKIEISHHTEMVDMRDSYSQRALDALLKVKGQKNFLWVNLLNLGKLNYFEHKTLTGDKALKRVSQIIRSVLRENDLPFKLAGSEFLIYLNNLDPVKALQVHQRLQQALNSDVELLNLYRDQVSYLQKKLETEAIETERQKISEAILEVQRLLGQDRFLLRDVPVVGTTGVDHFLNIELTDAIRN
jgi:diguanylate cyclase (GGDEF)-like protein